MQIFLDCKDIEGDIIEDLKTFPIKFGRKKVFTFLKISNLIIVSLFLFFGVFIFNILKLEIILIFLILFFNFYSYKLALEKKYLGYVLGGVEFFFLPIPILLFSLF